MSKFEKKSKDVLAKGTMERGEFDPKGKPLEVYNYWLENSNSDKAFKIRNGLRQENFCHYWRVVFFWSPMLRFGNSRAASILLGLVLLTLMLASLGGVGFALYMLATEATWSAIIPVAAVVGAGTAWIFLVGLVISKVFDESFSDSAGISVAIHILLVAYVGITAASVQSYGWIIGLLTVPGFIVVSVLAGFVMLLVGIGIRTAFESNKSQSALTTAKEFGSVGVNVVRTKKWKICPIVNVGNADK